MWFYWRARRLQSRRRNLMMTEKLFCRCCLRSGSLSVSLGKYLYGRPSPCSYVAPIASASLNGTSVPPFGNPYDNLHLKHTWTAVYCYNVCSAVLLGRFAIQTHQHWMPYFEWYKDEGKRKILSSAANWYNGLFSVRCLNIKRKFDIFSVGFSLV